MVNKKIDIRFGCTGCIVMLFAIGVLAATIAGISVKLFNWIIS